MSRIMRGVLVGLVSVIAFGFAAATAAATGTGPVRINTTATTATGTDTTLSVLTTAGVRGALCRQFIIGATITSSGGVTIPSSGVRFNTCTFSGTNVTITATRNWSGTIRHLDSLITGNPTAVTLDITGVGVRFVAAGCSFDVTGTALGSTAISAAHNVLVTVPSITFPSGLAANPLSLTVGNVSGALCPALSIQNGNLSAFFGVFNFSPGVVGAAL